MNRLIKMKIKHEVEWYKNHTQDIQELRERVQQIKQKNHKTVVLPTSLTSPNSTNKLKKNMNWHKKREQMRQQVKENLNQLEKTRAEKLDK